MPAILFRNRNLTNPFHNLFGLLDCCSSVNVLPVVDKLSKFSLLCSCLQSSLNVTHWIRSETSLCGNTSILITLDTINCIHHCLTCFTLSLLELLLFTELSYPLTHRFCTLPSSLVSTRICISIRISTLMMNCFQLSVNHIMLLNTLSSYHTVRCIDVFIVSIRSNILPSSTKPC